MSSAAPLKMGYIAKAQQEYEPPLIANENAFLGDVLSSEKHAPETPISMGFYRLMAGTPLVYKYTYDEMKIMLEGHMDITDETGQTVHAVPGDVLYFPKGATITFTTKTYGLACYTGQRKRDGA
ncbi:hypothetical protein AAFC00_001502 [Neodothiora populina]|uniref:Ethanolamine utilization protein n=1 Tax=Neodothiora populina TaxID=2781224 RepID=A0ABR3PP49_9PEZI